MTLIRGPHPISRSRLVRHQCHLIFSIKAVNRLVTVESALEADVVFMLEGDPQVKYFTEQDPRIPVPRTGASWTTLDFSARYEDSSEKHYEVKPVSKLEENSQGELAPKNWDAVQRWAEEAGHTVDFITDEDLASKKFTIQNWRALLPYVRNAREQPDPQLSFKIYEFVVNTPGTTVNKLIHQVSYKDRHRVVYITADYLHHGTFQSNLDRSIFDMNSPLFAHDSTDVGAETLPPTNPSQPVEDAHVLLEAA